jgi:RNA polymerase sigma factor (sigma-70 family)
MTLYIRSVLGAEYEAARDCAQEAFGKVFSKIIKGDHDAMEDVYGYMIRSARNEYLMKVRKEKYEVPIDEAKFRGKPIDEHETDAIEVLSSDDHQRMLSNCIDKLKNKQRKFFKAVLKNINNDDKVTSDSLGISYGSFRTRKSRVIDALRECIADLKGRG